jgi:phosphopantetheinyl transferase
MLRGYRRSPSIKPAPISGAVAARHIVERRSPLRVGFVDGWRKTIPGDGMTRTPAEQSFHLTGKSPPAQSISLWTAQVDTLLAASSNLNLLDDDDRASLRAIRSSAQRKSATGARILLRLSLSLATGRRIPPQQWRFRRTEFGKPFIIDDSEDVHFSVSHAGSVVMVAVGCDLELGLDVECLDHPIEETFIGNFCHELEQQTLQTLPHAQRQRRDIQLWTQKEAYSKMLGLGHSLEFSTFNLPWHNQTNEHHFSKMLVERFYLPLNEGLYYAALVIDRKARSQAVDIYLQNAVLPGQAACALSPSW